MRNCNVELPSDINPDAMNDIMNEVIYFVLNETKITVWQFAKEMPGSFHQNILTNIISRPVCLLVVWDFPLKFSALRKT